MEFTYFKGPSNTESAYYIWLPAPKGKKQYIFGGTFFRAGYSDLFYLGALSQALTQSSSSSPSGQSGMLLQNMFSCRHSPLEHGLWPGGQGLDAVERNRQRKYHQFCVLQQITGANEIQKLYNSPTEILQNTATVMVFQHGRQKYKSVMKLNIGIP